MKLLNTLLCILIVGLWVIPAPVQAADPLGFLFPMLKPPAPDYVIDGDKVVYEDENVYMDASPHTLSSSGWVTFRYKTKKVGGAMDVVFGFNDNLQISKPQFLNPEAVRTKYNKVESVKTATFEPVKIVKSTKKDKLASTEIVDIPMSASGISKELKENKADVGDKSLNSNYEQVECDVLSPIMGEAKDKAIRQTLNIAYDTFDGKKYTYKYNAVDQVPYTVIEEGLDDIKSPISNTVWSSKGMNKWQSVYSGKTANVNQLNETKVWIDIPFAGKGIVKGKYVVGLKPSSLTINQAEADGQLWLIDPWYDSSWLYRKEITIAGSVDGALTDYQIKLDISEATVDTVVFTSNSTFTVPSCVTEVEVLVVGGGGSTGGGKINDVHMAGGGGGQVVYNAHYAVTPGAVMPVTVGSGGIVVAGMGQGGVTGATGNISAFGTITALGGNGGYYKGHGGTSASGFIGGNCSVPPVMSNTSGGGGGDSANGTDGVGNDITGTKGLGGAGTLNSITGAEYEYGKGGNGWDRNHFYPPFILPGIGQGGYNGSVAAGAWPSGNGGDGVVIIKGTGIGLGCGGKVAADFDDLRFTTDDGQHLLDYWIESVSGVTPNQVATVWVEVDSIAASPANTTIYMYYGNAGAAAYSNITDTFLFGDDFSTAWNNPDKWDGDTASGSVAGGILTFTNAGGTIQIYSNNTYAGGIALRSRFTLPNTGGGQLLLADALAWNDFAYISHNVVGASTLQSYNNPNSTFVNPTAVPWVIGSYAIYDVIRDSGDTSSHYKMNNIEVAESPISGASVPNVDLDAMLRIDTNAGSELCDWILIRKYSTNEPTWGSFSCEETEPISTVITKDCTGFSTTWAVVNGENLGAATQVGFDYGLSTTYTESYWNPTGTYAAGSFSSYLSSLSKASVYHYRAKAVMGGVTYYGEDRVFATKGSPVLTSYFESGGDSDSRPIYSSNITYQTFTTNITVPHSVTSINLMLKAVGDPGTVTASIRNTALSPTANMTGTSVSNTTGLVGFEWETTSNTTLPLLVSPRTPSYTSNITLTGVAYGAGFSYNATLPIGHTYYYRSYSQNATSWYYGAETTIVGGTNSYIEAWSPVPTGNDIASGTLSGATFSTSYAMYSFPVTVETCLNANTTYAIVLSYTGGNEANYVLWQTDTGNGYPYGNAGFSIDSGLTWEAQSQYDQIFQVWGNPCIEVSDAKVFSSYIEMGDWLVTILYKNLYPPYYDEKKDVSSLFVLQLYNAATSTVIAQTKCFEWGYKPGAIYLSANSVIPLQWGYAYRVRLYGLFAGNPYSEYVLQPTDWMGSDLTRLDNWVRMTAALMEKYYNTALTVYLTDRGIVLNSAGGVIFATDIPQLSVIRPNLFSIVTSTPSYIQGTYTQAYQDTLVWTTMLGPQLTLAFDSVGATVGIGGATVGSWIGFMVYALVALFCFRPGHAIAAMCIPIPILLIAFGTGLAELALMGILLAVATIVFTWQFWWKGG